MKMYTYALIEFLTVIVCFIFSFDRRIRFNQHFLSFIKAAVIVAVPFIIWDILFTASGVWWFNYDYTVGLILCGLPVEEWLFFICIPFSCVFTFYVLENYANLDSLKKWNLVIAILIIAGCSALAIMNIGRMYTFVTGCAAVLSVVYLQFIAKQDWLAKSFVVYMVLMLGFFPVNGVLTGFGLDSPIVNYNSAEILNLRMLTIPVEDSIYGYAQFILVWYFFRYFKNRKLQKQLAPNS